MVLFGRDGADLILHAVASAFDHDRFGMVEQAVENGGSERAVVAEDLGPLFERLVGREDDRSALVALADDLGSSGESVGEKW